MSFSLFKASWTCLPATLLFECYDSDWRWIDQLKKEIWKGVQKNQKMSVQRLIMFPLMVPEGDKRRKKATEEWITVSSPSWEAASSGWSRRWCREGSERPWAASSRPSAPSSAWNCKSVTESYILKWTSPQFEQRRREIRWRPHFFERTSFMSISYGLNSNSRGFFSAGSKARSFTPSLSCFTTFPHSFSFKFRRPG